MQSVHVAVLGVLGAFALAGCSTDEPPAPVCTPQGPAAFEAYAKAHAPLSEDVAFARAIADRYLTEHPPEDASWDWGDGTLMAAMIELSRVTGDARYRDYARRFLDLQIAGGYSIVTSDRCPPALTALALGQETCEPKYRTVVEDVQRYLDSEAMRTESGGISHLGTVPIFGATLWIDSLFMFGEVLIRRAEAWGDTRALDLFGSQYRIFAKDMQDPNAGFFIHGYRWPGTQDPGVFWARGNGWVVAAGADYLRVRGARGESDEDVRASFVRLAQAVIATQDPATGLWWTVVNLPGETYLETSASALFALGLARAYRAGVLDGSVLPVIRRAMQGVRDRVKPDPQGRPVVTGISGPTMVGQKKDYAAVRLVDDIHFGVAAVVMALVEVSGL